MNPTQPRTRPLRSLHIATVATALVLGACGGKKDDDESGGLGHRVLSSSEIEEAKAYKHPLAEEYYKQHPEFFVTKQIADLPADLEWQNGAGQPEIGSSKATKGGTWTAALTDFPRTLRTRGPDSNGRMRNYIGDWMRVPLVDKHPNTKEYIPAMAYEWATDRSTATMYFKLRPEARWSDGVPITTDDFFFLFYFMRSPWLQAPYAADFFATKHSQIVKYDDHTFSLTAAEKRPDLEDWIVGLYPIPAHYYKDFGDDFVKRYNWAFPPSTGAYTISDDDIKKGRSITLRRLNNWWAKDLPYFKNRFNPDTIELKVIRDANKSFESFKRGDLSMARINLAEYYYNKLPDSDSLVKNGYIHKHTFYQDVPKSGYQLWFNTSKKPLDNRDVRIGLNHATDWGLVIERFFRGDWSRQQTFSDGYGELTNPSVRSREYSIEKAEAAFAKAGYTQRGPDGILVDGEGKRLSFTISTGYKTLADLLTILQEQAKKAGVEYKIELLDQTAGWKKSQEKKHEITLAGFATGVTEVYPRYWDFFHSDNAYQEDGSPKPNTNNLCVFSTAELDPLIKSYRASEDHDEKVRLAHQIEEILYDEAPNSPGVYMAMYRTGCWRWVQWPDDFNVNLSDDDRHWWIHWIDEDMEKETRAAMKSGKTFPPVIRTYEKYKP